MEGSAVGSFPISSVRVKKQGSDSVAALSGSPVCIYLMMYGDRVSRISSMPVSA